MENSNQFFKKMEQVDCPFCHKNFWISFQAALPYVNETTTDEEIESARQDLKVKLDSSQLIDKKTKEELYKFIDATPLTKNDVEPFLQQIIREQAEKKAKETD